jgi:hypothetical protein
MSRRDLEWTAFLQQYNAELLASAELAELLSLGSDDGLETAMQAGWLGFAGITEEKLAQAEERLGVPLPPSYRAFLRVSDGWRCPSAVIPRLWQAEELEWFRVTDPETIEAWSNGDPELAERLRQALRISDQEIAGTAVYLLIPDVMTAEREWEAWLFAHWVPGAVPYPSFRSLMEHERLGFLQSEAQAAKRLRPEDTSVDLAAKVTALVDELRSKARMNRQIQDEHGMGDFVTGATAAGLDEVAGKVRRLQERRLEPGALLASLRTLERETAQEHLAAHERWVQKRSAVDRLRLIESARALSRAEGLRQAAGVIDWFLKEKG